MILFAANCHCGGVFVIGCVFRSVVVTCLCLLASCSPQSNTQVTGGRNDLCRIELNNFCVTSVGDSYWISLTQKAGDLHGFVYFVEGTKRNDPTGRFLVAIRDAKSGAVKLSDAPEFCRIFRLPQTICSSKHRMPMDLTYPESFAEYPDVRNNVGIRIDVLETSNVEPADIAGIAVPCARDDRGYLRCGATLGLCVRSTTKWVGCRFRNIGA